MRKIVFCILLLPCFFCNLYGQEIYVDINTQDTCLFIGGISLDDGKALKVFSNGEITYRNPDDLIQTGLLIGSEFTDELFKQGLCFELSGYEPYWKASIYKDLLTVWVPEYDNPRQYKVNLHIGKDMSSVFFVMFSTECGSVFGTINNIGLTLNEKCRVCEYDIEAPSLYEAYLNIDGNAYRGCGNIGVIPVSYQIGNSLERNIRLYYFAEDRLYLRNFFCDEQSVVYNGFQMYQVDERGQFIRDYE